MSETVGKPSTPPPEAALAPTTSPGSDDNLISIEPHAGDSSPNTITAIIHEEESASSDVSENFISISPSREEKGKEPEHDVPEITGTPSSRSHEYHPATVEDVEDEDEDERQIPLVLVTEENELADSSKMSSSSETKVKECCPACSASTQPQGEIPIEQDPNRETRSRSQRQPGFEMCDCNPVSSCGPFSMPQSSPSQTPVLFPHARPPIPVMTYDRRGHYGTHGLRQRRHGLVNPHHFGSGGSPPARGRSGSVVLSQAGPSTSKQAHKSQRNSRHQVQMHEEIPRAREARENLEQCLQQSRARLTATVQQEVDRRIREAQKWGDDVLANAEAYAKRQRRKLEALLSNDEENLLDAVEAIEEEGCLRGIKLQNENARLYGIAVGLEDDYIRGQTELLQEETEIFDRLRALYEALGDVW